METGHVEDVNSRGLAREVRVDVAADGDHLAVPDVAGMTGTGVRNLTGFGLVDFDPCEGGYGENPHVVFLCLIASWYEVLSAVHVDVVG